MIGADIRALLARSELFRGLPDAAADRAIKAASLQMAPAGTTLFHQGDPPEHLMVVGKGLVRIWRVNGKGDSSTIRLMAPGNAIGCVAVFRQTPYPATATAVIDSLLLSWPAAWIREATEQSPAMRANSLDMIGQRAEELVRRLNETATERVEQRIARALLRLAAQAGHAFEGGTRIAHRLSRQDIAEIVDTDLYVVSRVLRRWAGQHIVRADRLCIVLLDQPRLERIAAGAA